MRISPLRVGRAPSPAEAKVWVLSEKLGNPFLPSDSILYGAGGRSMNRT